MVGLVPRRPVGEVDADVVAEALQRAQERHVRRDPRHPRAGLRAGALAAAGRHRGPGWREVRHDHDLPADAVGLAARLERLEQPAQPAVDRAARRSRRAAAGRGVPVGLMAGARLRAVPVDEHAHVARAQRDGAGAGGAGSRRGQHPGIGLGQADRERRRLRRRGRRRRARQQARDADLARGGVGRCRGGAQARERRDRDAGQRQGSASPQLGASLRAAEASSAPFFGRSRPGDLRGRPAARPRRARREAGWPPGPLRGGWLGRRTGRAARAARAGRERSLLRRPAARHPVLRDDRCVPRRTPHR